MAACIYRSRIKETALLLLFAAVLAAGYLLIDQEKKSLPASVSASEAPDIVATVQGREISARIYRMYLKNGIEAFGLDDQTEQGRSRIDLLKQGIIEDLIDRAVIEEEARRSGIQVLESELAEACNLKVSQMGGSELYRSYLAAHSLSDDDFRSIVLQELYAKKLEQEITRGLDVSEDEIRSFYEAEKFNPEYAAIFKAPEMVQASHILIASRRSMIASEIRSRRNAAPNEIDSLVSEEVERRRQRALAILGRARKGADFFRLAREHSDDPATRERGGDLGLFTRDAHTKPFDDAAFALRPGQISDIIETEYGFHIIKVARREAERTRSLDETAGAIKERLLATRSGSTLRRWIEERRRSSEIRIEDFYNVGGL
ncbi:MAG TPA: peptidylprolyl isomerase [Blastocatellia bacterium]|nr:peptidylprolyl isomerase [Blastocatellia bacterium]